MKVLRVLEDITSIRATRALGILVMLGLFSSSGRTMRGMQGIL